MWERRGGGQSFERVVRNSGEVLTRLRNKFDSDPQRAASDPNSEIMLSFRW